MSQPQFIQERLDKLYELDTKIASLLDNLSSVFSTLQSGKQQSSTSGILSSREQISNQTKDVYSTISDIAINLRKEIKIMDDNIGKCENNEGIMILPINIIQKNTKLNSLKLIEELKDLDELLPTESSPKTDQSPQQDVEMAN